MPRERPFPPSLHELFGQMTNNESPPAPAIPLEAHMHDLMTKLGRANEPRHFQPGDVVCFLPGTTYNERRQPGIVADVKPWDSVKTEFEDGTDSSSNCAGLRPNVTLAMLHSQDQSIAFYVADERALRIHHEGQAILDAMLRTKGEIGDDWLKDLQARAVAWRISQGIG
jgi:hypothetical protein